jgi:hypothetical protein
MTKSALLETLLRLADQAARAQVEAHDDRNEFIARGHEEAYRKIYVLLKDDPDWARIMTHGVQQGHIENSQED